MKNINLKWLTVLAVITISYIFTSCRGKTNDLPTTQQTLYSKPCLEWKSEKNRVVDYMNGFNLTDEETNYLYYAGKKIENVITYQFQNNGGLCTVALTIPSSNISLIDLKSTFNKYTYLGVMNDTQVYINEAENTVATISTVVKGSTSYYAVGWSQLK